MQSKEELFFSITGLDPLTHNVNQLERIHMKGYPPHIAITMNDKDDDVPELYKPFVYPFDLAWEKVEDLKKRERNTGGITEALQDLRYEEI